MDYLLWNNLAKEIPCEGVFYADSHTTKHHVQGVITGFSETGDIDFLYSEDKLRKYKLINPRHFFLLKQTSKSFPNLECPPA